MLLKHINCVQYHGCLCGYQGRGNVFWVYLAALFPPFCVNAGLDGSAALLLQENNFFEGFQFIFFGKILNLKWWGNYIMDLKQFPFHFFGPNILVNTLEKSALSRHG